MRKTRHTRHSRRYLLIPLAIAAAVVPALALAWAPYLPRLAFEGYPPETWPATGSFARVDGVQQRSKDVRVDPSDTPIDPRGRQLFEESGGRALLVYQGGRLRLERYGNGASKATRLNSYSLAKSLVGALVLRAHADGLIANLDDPIGLYITDLPGADLRSLSILALLRMRSGIVFEDPGPKTMFADGRKSLEATRFNPFGPMVRLHMGGLDSILPNLSVSEETAGKYVYQNVNTSILGRLVTRLYRKPLEQVLAEKVWGPAGAGNAMWRRYGPGLAVSPYCCLYATPRDWLSVGIFLMRNGRPGEPFLPDALWRHFLGLDATVAKSRGSRYGLHTYRNVLDRSGEALRGGFTYFFGRGGQTVYLMPEKDLVVIRFGEKIQLLHTTLYTAWRSIGHKEGER